MVLLELNTDDAVILLGSISVAAILLGWLADGVLEESGFGLRGNVIFCLLGACGGLYALDYAFTSRYLPLSLFDAATWIFAAALGAAFSMILAALFKVLAVRA